MKLYRVKLELERFFVAKDETDALEQFGDNMQTYEMEGFMEPEAEEIEEATELIEQAK